MPPDRSAPRRLRGHLALPLLALFAGSCGGGDGDFRLLERVETQLVGRAEVFESVGGAPPEFGYLFPTRSISSASSLPSLILHPPAAVTLTVPEVPPGARLRFAVAVDSDSYTKGVGALAIFRVLDGGSGEVLFEHRTPVRSDVDVAQRTWTEAVIPVTTGRVLLLEAAAEGPGASEVVAGFGLLEVVRTVPVPRKYASSPEPNVVLVVVDTLRADFLGAYGDDRGTTPCLDELAKSGTVFERAYSPSSWTLPSTASILTGLEPPEHGAEGPDSAYLSTSLVTLAETLAEAGWACGALSTNPLIVASKEFDQGFTTFEEEAWADSGPTVARANAWIEDNADDRFFLYLHLTDPHTPYAPARDLIERFAPEVLASPDWVEGETWRQFLERRGEDSDEEEWRDFLARSRALYACEVAAVDRALRSLVDTLERLGLRDDTVIALTSDHGEEFFEHGLIGHGKQLYEETLRVPLVLNGPGVPTGRRHREPVEISNLAHTLLGLAGAEAAALPGADLLDETRMRNLARGPLFFSTHTGNWLDLVDREVIDNKATLLGVQVGPDRFVWSEGTTDHCSLFDLERDPAERQSLAAERPADVEEYRRMIREWLDAAEAVRPNVLSGDRATGELMKDLGYVGDH